MNHFDPSLTETTSGGWGIVRLDPGEYEVAMSHSSLSKCTPQRRYWAGSDDEHARVHAVAGYWNFVEFECE